MTAIFNQYTDEEFEQIWKQSFSMKEFAINLGYKTYSGDAGKRIRTRVDRLNLSDEHFTTKRPIKRNIENVFCKNSTAHQSTLRKWYLTEGYSEYKCAICGQEPFWNGKKLSLTLDHINGDNHDNRLENLRWICPNCDRQLETFGSKNKVHPPKKRYYCVDCGQEVCNNTAVRCVQCNAKHNRKSDRPTRDKLKDMIRSTSFVELGRCFNVSDNAIRKWCAAENLPTKKSDIKQYSDEEWASI